MTYRPNLLRGVTICLVVALTGNVWLTGFANRTGFTVGLGIASGAVAAALVATAALRPLDRWRDDVYLAAMAVWLANAIELALASEVATPGRIRNTAVYAALAVVALSANLNLRLHR